MSTLESIHLRSLADGGTMAHATTSDRTVEHVEVAISTQ